jgi:hypothetical protein
MFLGEKDPFHTYAIQQALNLKFEEYEKNPDQSLLQKLAFLKFKKEILDIEINKLNSSYSNRKIVKDENIPKNEINKWIERFTIVVLKNEGISLEKEIRNLKF